jgi:hypothetical protein
MKIRMIAPVRNFNMEMEEITLAKGLKIISGARLEADIQLGERFKEQVGTLNWELVTHHSIFYFEGEASDFVGFISGNMLTAMFIDLVSLDRNRLTLNFEIS